MRELIPELLEFVDDVVDDLHLHLFHGRHGRSGSCYPEWAEL